MKLKNVPMKGMVCLGVLLAAIVYPALAQEKPAGQRDKPKAEEKVFTFGGGDLGDFVAAVSAQFGFNLREAASIDRSAINLRIPKMKIPAVTRWESVLSRYNILSGQTENYERLGRWVVSPDPERVNSGGVEAIIFVPPKNVAQEASVKVKAFSLDKLKKEDLNAFYKTLAVEVTNLQDTGMGAFHGQVRYHESTGLLIASGDQNYVELATAIIEAFKETVSRRGPHINPE